MNFVAALNKSKLRKLTLGIFVSLLAFVFILVPQAYAIASIGVSPAGGAPLSTVRVVGQGFCGTCGPVTVTMNGLVVLSNITVDASGLFSATIKVPGTARPGPNTISANQDTKSTYIINASSTFDVVINPNVNGTPYQAPPNLPPQQTPNLRVAKQNNSSGNNQSMFHSFAHTFVGVLYYIIPLLIIMALVFVWTKRFAMKKQQQVIDSMKQEIDREVAAPDKLKSDNDTEIK